MKEKNITVVSRDDPRKGKTDWKKFRDLTDAEIEAGMAKDPVWRDFNELDWSEGVVVIPPKKKAISIRIDEDVLEFFKEQGTGYQRHMNAVLRSYVTQKSKKHA